MIMRLTYSGHFSSHACGLNNSCNVNPLVKEAMKMAGIPELDFDFVQGFNRFGSLHRNNSLFWNTGVCQKCSCQYAHLRNADWRTGWTLCETARPCRARTKQSSRSPVNNHFGLKNKIFPLSAVTSATCRSESEALNFPRAIATGLWLAKLPKRWSSVAICQWAATFLSSSIPEATKNMHWRVLNARPLRAITALSSMRRRMWRWKILPDAI